MAGPNGRVVTGVTTSKTSKKSSACSLQIMLNAVLRREFRLEIRKNGGKINVHAGLVNTKEVSGEVVEAFRNGDRIVAKINYPDGEIILHGKHCIVQIETDSICRKLICDASVQVIAAAKSYVPVEVRNRQKVCLPLREGDSERRMN